MRNSFTIISEPPVVPPWVNTMPMPRPISAPPTTPQRSWSSVGTTTPERPFIIREDSTVENTVQYKNCFPNFHTPMARSGMFMSSTSVPVGIFVA